MRLDTRSLGLALGLLLGAGVACAQSQNCTMTGADGKTVTIPGCNTSSPAQKFPYPGEGSPASPADQAPATPAAPAATPAPAAPDTAPASKRFPYPGEADAPPAPAATGGDAGNAGGLKDAGSSGTSSDSSSSSSSSSALGDAGLPATDDGPLSGADDAAKARRARRKLPPVVRQTPTEREEEDIRVAGFYQDDGDYRGAYLRGKDAVSIAASDPDAHFVLAEAARKLGKLDEALDNYKQCLKLDPIPKEKKAAEKALKEMQGGGA